MLKDLINKEVNVTYEVGYNYKCLKGVVTKVTTDYLTIDNKVLIATKKIIKVVIKTKK
ncbi:MAG: hypothetical protein PHH51_01540 [Bacilli bacterium]|nr:hypothetical protein [Bacilli bacterium]MDD3895628.1 hypothetical protein [Bacilli bacterium]MDD4407709.1 hypothetical protein [Bacilli bacterium]